ncbi:hypothetical protein RvY_14441 [Ramazzottius varieornatus]|uniref:Uncharacterized protein n=1 Tax=Ramazzottius varieornatus TaxID=947166 RepID=A0A1D1VV41_RAMVA|nr:hypothetical protein RvY_14441 [Ramazzottius varieornatus]
MAIKRCAINIKSPGTVLQQDPASAEGSGSLQHFNTNLYTSITDPTVGMEQTNRMRKSRKM